MNALNTLTDNPAPESNHPAHQDSVITQLMQNYAHFNRDTVDTIVQLYHADALFIDPVKTVEGRDQLHAYFSAMAEGLLECQFTFNQVLTQINADSVHQASLFWTMHYRHPKLRGGALLELAGTSHIKYSDTIIYHRDYYDLGQMLYQHLPLLRQVIAIIKNRM
ncbi:MAG TPA: nuclear transport factor 2 family protein [Cellvibrionaceae bacterium]